MRALAAGRADEDAVSLVPGSFEVGYVAEDGSAHRGSAHGCVGAFPPKAVILSGGPASAHEASPPRAPQRDLRAGRAGAGRLLRRDDHVRPAGRRGRERPPPRIRPRRDPASPGKPAAGGVWAKGEREPVWMSHGDKITAMPPGFDVVATSDNAPFAVIADEARRFYGVQFHPEVVHTPRGARAAAQLHPQHRRAAGRLDHGRLQRRGDRAHPRAGGQRAGDLRPFRRRRFARWPRC